MARNPACRTPSKRLPHADSQTQRFSALCQWGDMAGCTVMDLGCGYGDLKLFLDSRFADIHYLGIDFLPEFIAGAEARYTFRLFAG